MNGLDIFMDVLGYLAAVGIAVFSMPGLIACIKTKRTSDVNMWLFLILMVSSLLFWITGFYGIGVRGFNAFNCAVAVANVFSWAIALAILVFKWVNMSKAKKLNLTEKEYEQQRAEANKSATK
ncbi:MAG: hypothetical protein HUJ42_02375 [Malacoplasma sp.]|nr:hypothetical protein [Malacoplasma sp.]